MISVFFLSEKQIHPDKNKDQRGKSARMVLTKNLRIAHDFFSGRASRRFVAHAPFSPPRHKIAFLPSPSFPKSGKENKEMRNSCSRDPLRRQTAPCPNTYFITKKLLSGIRKKRNLTKSDENRTLKKPSRQSGRHARKGASLAKVA